MQSWSLQRLTAVQSAWTLLPGGSPLGFCQGLLFPDSPKDGRGGRGPGGREGPEPNRMNGGRGPREEGRAEGCTQFLAWGCQEEIE